MTLDLRVMLCFRKAEVLSEKLEIVVCLPTVAWMVMCQIENN